MLIFSCSTKCWFYFLLQTQYRRTCFSEPAILRGASLPPRDLYLATASLTVLLQGKGNITAACCVNAVVFTNEKF